MQFLLNFFLKFLFILIQINIHIMLDFNYENFYKIGINQPILEKFSGYTYIYIINILGEIQLIVSAFIKNVIFRI